MEPTPSLSAVSNNGNQAKNKRKSEWSASDFPYAVDYNDHFETPLIAYQDVQPLIDWLAEQQGKSRDDICIYDPYYCNGRTAVLLRDHLGYKHVVHEKRDFYLDIAANSVPAHDILMSNPPYSDTHKTQCLEFCFEQLRSSNRPFLLLMPAYTAAKQYYRSCLQQQNSVVGREEDDDVVYIIPDRDYHYDHPENTGKDESPFASLWFCGIGRDRVAALKRFWENQSSQQRRRLAVSLQELQSHRVLSLQNRPNPRQRRKRQKKQLQSADQVKNDAKDPAQSETNATQQSVPAASAVADEHHRHKGSRKNSKYRDQSGKRTKRRF